MSCLLLHRYVRMSTILLPFLICLSIETWLIAGFQSSSFANGREPCDQLVKTSCRIHGEHLCYRFNSLFLDGRTGWRNECGICSLFLHLPCWSRTSFGLFFIWLLFCVPPAVTAAVDDNERSLWKFLFETRTLSLKYDLTSPLLLFFFFFFFFLSISYLFSQSQKIFLKMLPSPLMVGPGQTQGYREESTKKPGLSDSLFAVSRCSFWWKATPLPVIMASINFLSLISCLIQFLGSLCLAFKICFKNFANLTHSDSHSMSPLPFAIVWHSCWLSSSSAPTWQFQV